jgi:hypothetical protein
MSEVSSIHDVTSERVLSSEALLLMSAICLFLRIIIPPDLSPPDVFLFSGLQSVLKGQRFSNAERVITKAMRALTEVSKNEF